MKTIGTAIIALSLLFAPLVSAEEPPDDDLVREALAEAGYSEWNEASTTAADYLRLKFYTEDLRFRRSNVRVLRIDQQYRNVRFDRGLQAYIEVVAVPLGGETVYFSRPLSPEEVQKRTMEASGVPPALMAEAMEVYASGAMVLGETLRQAMVGNEFGQEMIGNVGGYPMRERNFDPSEDHPRRRGLSGEEWCIEMMMKSAHDESLEKEIEIKPWTSMNPATFMMGPACMALAASNALTKLDQGDPQIRQTIANDIEDMLNGIVPAGTWLVNQRMTRELRVEGLNIVQPMGANFGDMSDDYRQASASIPEALRESAPAMFTYAPEDEPDLSPYIHRTRAREASTVTIHSIAFWIDTEYLVERKMRMEGTMTEGRESRQVFFERELQDYRNVPDSALYMPYRTVMRAGGVLTEAQQKELAQAQKQLEEFDRQLAAMPAGQRQMMENMMGSQVEQMRSLVDNGTVEIVMETTNIEINPSFRDPMLVEFANRELDGSEDSGENLVQRIQVDLATLGYEPGNTDGVLDTMTQVAISQFEAESKLPVTGEASVSVAMALAEAVRAR